MRNRQDSFSMNIHDPESMDSSANIRVENINEELLLIFKENSIYSVLTADSTDPEKLHPDTAHTYEKIATVGAASPYVARVLLQFKEIFDIVISEQKLRNNLLREIWKLNEQLLNCLYFAQNIYSQTDKAIHKCDEIIEKNKATGLIPPLVKVKNLEDFAKSFLLIGKQVLIGCFRLISLFTSLPLNSQNEAHFDKHVKWLEQNAPELEGLSTMLTNDLSWIRRLSECRNAIEHPGTGQSLTIENIKLQPGNKFSLPTWSYDISKKVGLKESNIYIHQELESYLHNMLHLIEDVLLICTSSRLPSNGMLSLYQRKEEDINPKCPIKYYVGLNNDFKFKPDPN